MKRLVFGIAAVVLATCVHAQDKQVVLGLHLVSVHDSPGYQNDNPGIYARYGAWTGGVFQNSVNKQSVYAGYTLEWETPQVPLVDSVALTLGVASGYPQKISGTDVSMLIVPTAAFKIYKDIRLRVAYIPAFQQYVGATAVHFMIEKSF